MFSLYTIASIKLKKWRIKWFKCCKQSARLQLHQVSIHQSYWHDYCLLNFIHLFFGLTHGYLPLNCSCWNRCLPSMTLSDQCDFCQQNCQFNWSWRSSCVGFWSSFVVRLWKGRRCSWIPYACRSLLGISMGIVDRWCRSPSMNRCSLVRLSSFGWTLSGLSRNLQLYHQDQSEINLHLHPKHSSWSCFKAFFPRKRQVQRICHHVKSWQLFVFLYHL